MSIGNSRPKTIDKRSLRQVVALHATVLSVTTCLAAVAQPVRAADLDVTSGTFTVTAPGDVPQSRVVVDDTADADATLKINSGVTFGKDIILNNGGSLINEGTIFRTGGGNDGVFGDVGLARVTNRAGGAITVDDIGMWLKADGTVLNTGLGTSINGRIGIDIAGTADVTNELGAEINAGTGAGLYLNDGTVINRSGATIISEGAEGVRMSGTGSVTNTGENSAIGGGTLGVTIQGAGSSLINEDGATIHGGTLAADIFGDITNTGAGSKISSDQDGVLIRGGATLHNEDGAEIEAEYLAVNIYDGGDVYNTGGSKITSHATDGIDVWIYGSVTNSGEGSAIIAGGYAGVYFNPYDPSNEVFSLTNSDKAAIQGDSYGVMFDGAEGHVTNEGGATITGVNGTGVAMNYSGGVINSSGGEITGAVAGLYLRNDDASFSFTVTNTGEGSSITATDASDADGIFITGAGSSVTNADGAAISGSRFGAWMVDGGSFTNEGENTGISGATALLTGQAATIINRDEARIDGVLNGVTMDGGGSLTNETGAAISASDATGVGVKLSSGGTLSNESGATIFGTLRGAQGWGADITNKGEGSAITSDGTAVQTWAGGGSVTNDDGATMHGGENGVLLDNSTELTNKGGATIIGDTGNGVLSFNGGTVTNTGENSAISGGAAGILLQGGAGTVVNTDGASITSDYGAIGLFQGGSVTNGAGSTIEGGVYGIYVDGGGASISNAGRIIGDVGLSTAYDNDVTLYSGGSIDGDLFIDNRTTSTLTFDGAGDQLLSDAVTGNISFGGVLTKQGAGTWTIDKNLLAATTNVTAGGLVVGIDGHGNLLGDVNVSLGAWLGGSGTIYGDVTVGGTVAPGNSPGVLHIVGDYTQTAGSIFQAQIDTDSGLYDQISATGIVTIDPGAVLNVTRTGSAPYVVGAQYVFVSAASISGNYVVTGDLAISPFLTLTDHYDPGIGYLEVQQTMSLSAGLLAPTTNQTSLVNAVQSTPASPLFVALTNLPSVAAMNALLPQLTGEIYPSIAGAMLEDSRYIRNAAMDRIEDANCGDLLAATKDCGANPLRLWSSVIGAWAHDNSAANVAAMSRTTGGVLFGADTTYNDFWRAGLLTGYGLTHYEMNSLSSSATSKDLHLGVYVGTLPGQLAVKLGALRTWHHVEAGRTALATGFYDHLDADYHAATTQLFGEAGYRLASTGNKVQPFVNLTFLDNRVSDFSERGGAAALDAEGGNNSIVLTTLGLHLNDTLSMGASKIAAKGTIGWRNASGDTTPSTVFAIGGSAPYRIDGLPVSRNALTMKADIETLLSEAVTFGLSADGQVGRDKAAMGLQARLAINF